MQNLEKYFLFDYNKRSHTESQFIDAADWAAADSLDILRVNRVVDILGQIYFIEIEVEL